MKGAVSGCIRQLQADPTNGTKWVWEGVSSEEEG
jgi:hypothetical protein